MAVLHPLLKMGRVWEGTQPACTTQIRTRFGPDRMGMRRCGNGDDGLCYNEMIWAAGRDRRQVEQEKKSEGVRLHGASKDAVTTEKG